MLISIGNINVHGVKLSFYVLFLEMSFHAWCALSTCRCVELSPADQGVDCYPECWLSITWWIFRIMFKSSRQSAVSVKLHSPIRLRSFTETADCLDDCETSSKEFVLLGLFVKLCLRFEVLRIEDFNWTFKLLTTWHITSLLTSYNWREV